MKLINADALKQSLIESRDRCREWVADCDEAIKPRAEQAVFTFNECITRTNEQPGLQWIPCEERLPEENGTYLITGKSGKVYTITYKEGRWYGGTAPLAWMCTPDPYTKETT